MSSNNQNSERKSLGSIVIKSSIGKALSVSFDFLRNIIFIKLLSAEFYGLLSLCNNAVQSSKYFDFGFSGKFLIDSYDASIDQEKIASVFSAIVVFEVLFLSLILFVFNTALMQSSWDLFLSDSEVSNSLFIFVGITFLAARIFKLSIIWSRSNLRFVRIAIVELSISLTILGISMLVFFEDFSEFVETYFLLQSLTFIIFSFIQFKEIKFAKLDFHWLKRNLKPSLILTSATVIFGFSFYVDRFILLTYFSLTEVGHYAVLLFVLNMFNLILTYSIEPFRANICAQIAKGDITYRIQSLQRICFYAGACFAIIGGFLIEVLMPFFLQISSIILPNYTTILLEFKLLFKICLTLPLLFLLGYIVVASPYKKILLFTISQISGLICVCGAFWIFNFEKSIYWILLSGIYFGNVFKIFWYLAVLIKSNGKYSDIHLTVLSASPFFLLPWF